MPAGVMTTIAGKYGSRRQRRRHWCRGQPRQPHGVAVDAAGDLYVCDQTNNTIRKIMFTK